MSTRTLADNLGKLPDFFDRVDAAEQEVLSMESRLIEHVDLVVEFLTNALGGDGKVPTYEEPFYGAKVYATPRLILPHDDYRLAVSIQAPEAFDIAIGVGNPSPDFSNRFLIVRAGGVITASMLRRKPIYVVGRHPPGSAAAAMDPLPPIQGDLTIFTERLKSGEPPALSTGDQVFGGWTAPVRDDGRAAVVAFVNALDAAGTWTKVKSFHLVGTGAANDAINLAKPAGKQAVDRNGATGILRTSYGAIQSGGDAIVNTQLDFVADLGMTGSNHALYLWPEASPLSVAGATEYTMGGSTIALQANRTASTAAFRSGAGNDTPQISIPAGSRIGLSRLSSTEYTQYVNGQPILPPVPRAFSSMPTRPLSLLGLFGGTSVTNVTKVPGRAFISLVDATHADMAKIDAEMVKLMAVFDRLRGS